MAHRFGYGFVPVWALMNVVLLYRSIYAVAYASGFLFPTTTTGEYLHVRYSLVSLTFGPVSGETRAPTLRLAMFIFCWHLGYAPAVNFGRRHYLIGLGYASTLCLEPC